MATRRDFNFGLASLAFGGLALAGCSHVKKLPDYMQRIPDYGTRDANRVSLYDLVQCPEFPKLLVPAGFRCRMIPQTSDFLSAGTDSVPGAADGMGAFAAGPDEVILVRNHERTKKHGDGGTTTVHYNYREDRVIAQYRSLSRTRRNCAGGVTPWGTWLSCEEDLSDGHGHVYEVPALDDHTPERQPLRQLGRFNHEAAAVDPLTGAVYMTEDQIDGLFYRFMPTRPPSDGRADRVGETGKLQALAFKHGGTDSRNWHRPDMVEGRRYDVHWVTLNDPSWPEPDQQRGLNDPRKWAYRSLGAVRFACGEGIHLARTPQGQHEIYFTCTSGGRIKSGQVLRFVPDRSDPDGGALELFFESIDEHALNFVDNLTIAPNGHLILCEDPYVGGGPSYLWRKIDKSAPAYLRGITPGGQVYDIARLDNGSELAGVCFSPDGTTMFVNVYDTGTFAITGPWGECLADWSIPQAGPLPS